MASLCTAMHYGMFDVFKWCSNMMDRNRYHQPTVTYESDMLQMDLLQSELYIDSVIVSVVFSGRLSSVCISLYLARL
jgi:hypothetical protein